MAYIPRASGRAYGLGLTGDVMKTQKDLRRQAQGLAGQKKKRGFGQFLGGTLGSVVLPALMGATMGAPGLMLAKAAGRGLGTYLGGKLAGSGPSIKPSGTGLMGSQYDILKTVRAGQEGDLRGAALGAGAASLASGLTSAAGQKLLGDKLGNLKSAFGKKMAGITGKSGYEGTAMGKAFGFRKEPLTGIQSTMNPEALSQSRVFNRLFGHQSLPSNLSENMPMVNPEFMSPPSGSYFQEGGGIEGYGGFGLGDFQPKRSLMDMLKGNRPKGIKELRSMSEGALDDIDRWKGAVSKVGNIEGQVEDELLESLQRKEIGEKLRWKSDLSKASEEFGDLGGSMEKIRGAMEAEKVPTAGFVKPNKTPQSYVDRYYNTTGRDPKYKSWFDKNYGDEWGSIEESVGLPEGTGPSTGQFDVEKYMADREIGSDELSEMQDSLQGRYDVLSPESTALSTLFGDKSKVGRFNVNEGFPEYRAQQLAKFGMQMGGMPGVSNPLPYQGGGAAEVDYESQLTGLDDKYKRLQSEGVYTDAGDLSLSSILKDAEFPLEGTQVDTLMGGSPGGSLMLNLEHPDKGKAQWSRTGTNAMEFDKSSERSGILGEWDDADKARGLSLGDSPAFNYRVAEGKAKKKAEEGSTYLKMLQDQGYSQDKIDWMMQYRGYQTGGSIYNQPLSYQMGGMPGRQMPQMMGQSMGRMPQMGGPMPQMPQKPIAPVGRPMPQQQLGQSRPTPYNIGGSVYDQPLAYQMGGILKYKRSPFA